MKRLLIILCLTVLLVVLAVPALAADGDTHSHCLCCDGALTEGCDHTDVKEFTEVTTYEELQGVIDAAQDGGTVNVYVGAEFAASSSNITINNKTVNLCLNDKTIILGKKFVVNGNGTLNITACGGGQIKAKEGNTAGQLLIAGNSSGTGHISMYDGTVDAGNVDNGDGLGGAVYLNASNSSFTLYGGTIVGAGKIRRGGGVYVNNASAVFYMYGGEITGGHATQYGGAINVATGSVEMSGGIITGCSADTNGGGVSLLIGATRFTLSGDAKIYGNTADDVYIGNSNKTDTYFLTLGRWEGNGKDENGNARTLKLVHKEQAADRKVIGYAEGVTNPAAMRSYFAVSDGYQLMADAEKMTLQDSTAHIHCICNGNAVGKAGHICEDLIWTAATQASFAPDTEAQADDTKLFYDYSDGYRLKANSNIYLTEDVSLTTEKYRTNGKTLNLCLCDQTVTVGSGSNLHVSRDSSANNNFGYLNITDHSNGQILADGCSAGFLYIERGHLSMYGGKVDANSKGINVVSMYTSGTFALYSGTVTGGSSAAGGNVQVRSGCTFTMYGGNIENGTATTTKTAGGTGGGNVYVADGGTFYMHGGTISGGQCASSFGGNVCVLGSMDMTGGTISGGSAHAGGNVAVSSNNNNTSESGVMTMSGGIITGGLASGRGNGVYIRNNSNDMTLSGDAKIYGNNTDTGDQTDISMAKAMVNDAYRVIKLDGWNGNGKNENGQANPKLVADREGDFAQRFAVFAEGAEIDGRAATYFASKTSGYYVLLNEDDQLIFVNTPGNVTLRSGSAVLASFSKLQDAVIAAQGSNDIVVLNQPLTEDVTVSGNVYVDLNGFDVTGKMTVGQGRLYLIDRATADYTVETDEEGNVTGGYGKITGGVTGDYAVTFNTPKATYGNNWKYLVLADEDGAVHAHRIYLAVSDAVLYPQTTSLKYKTVFYADEVAAGAIGDYGIILSETNEVSASFGAPLAYAGENNNSKLTLLSKVLETDMELLEQIERSGKQITARAYIKLNGVQDNVLESSPKTVSFESVVTTVLHWTEEEAKDMTIAQKMAMVDMHNSYNDLIHSWCGDTEEEAQSVQIHCDWMANIRCVCLGQNEGHEGHLTCEYSYYEAVSTAEEFAAYFTDNVLDRDASLRLTGDFTLSSAFNLGGHTLNLWLNGRTITMTGTACLTANANGELNITDSGENGKILAAEGCKETLVNTDNGILNLYGGIIDASAIRLGTGGSTVGAAVSMGQEMDQFHMYGGKLVGGQVNRGGTLYVYRGSAKIYGGEITGGTAALGGNVSVNFGSLELYGGKIYGGTATNGAGVHIGANAKNKTLLLTGNAMIYGNGTEDVYLGSATASDNYLTLDGWNGNGENGALVLGCRGAAADSVVAIAKEGELTQADAAKIIYSDENLISELAEGKLVLRAYHRHCLCANTLQEGCDHSKLIFTEIASADAFLEAVLAEGTETVNIVLTESFTLTGAQYIKGKTVNLCLNGQTLTMSGAKLIAQDATVLNITACNGGEIKAGTKTSRQMLYAHTGGGQINLYAGTVNAGAVENFNDSQTGGAVQIKNNTTGDATSTFTMYGGKIIGGKVYRGGAVYVDSGKFVMRGGEITEGRSTNGGAGVCVNTGHMEMSGGTITGCVDSTTSTPKLGGGVCMLINADSITLSGTAKIYGNTSGGVANDLYIGNKSKTAFYLILDQWEGNGKDENEEPRGLHFSTHNDKTAGAVIAQAKEGALTADDRAKLSYTGGTYALELNAEGKIVLSDGHTHCLCNGTQADAEGHTCTELTFTEVASADEFKALFNAENKLEAAANVVLTADITLDASYESNGYTWNLCLNGYGITLENGGKLSDDCKVLDCTRSGGVTTNVDLVMFMGQSNMAGRGVASQSEVVPAGQGYEFRAISDPTKLYPIAEPFGVNENNSASGVTETTKTGSMVSSFVKAYYEEMQVPVVAVSCSKGSTGLDFWQVNGNALNDAIARHEAAKNWLHANAYTVGNDFMVWCQGETDGGKGMSAADYSNGLKGIIEEMVTETGIDFCAVVRIGNARNNATRHAQIIKAQTQLCKSFDKAVLVSAKLAGFGADMMKDDYHYTQPAYNEVGKDAGTNAAAYVKTGIEPAMYDPQYKNNYPADDIPEGTAVTSLEFTFDSATENGVQLTDIGTVADGALKVTDETNGSKNGILLPADKQFTISPDKSFTLEFVTTGTEGVTLLGSGSSTGGFVYFSPASSPKVRLRFDSKSKQFEATTQAVFATEKTHIAIVYDADTKTLSMYQDGVALTVTGDMSNFGTITFTTLCGGYMNTTNNYYYRGDLHYFRYVEQALTVDQFHQEP